MPLFNVTIKKQYNGNLQTWGNRYIVRADTIEAASFAADSILVDAERDWHGDNVNFLELLTSSREEFDTEFISIALGGSGNFEVTDVAVPIQTVVESVINFGSGSRPGRKFYHVCAGRDMLTDVQTWHNDIIGPVQSGLAAALVAMNSLGQPVVSPGDNEGLTCVTKATYRYHQFTKASKRALGG